MKKNQEQNPQPQPSTSPEKPAVTKQTIKNLTVKSGARGGAMTSVSFTK